MKRLIAIAVSILVNAGALAVIGIGIDQSATPHGKVYITELTAQTDLPVVARANDVSKPHSALQL
ncbi:MAG TPA: hypothetical protein VKB34_03620 [Povalibacter sp.]|nr:hypothetical protein [Povalibacter sp.]